MKRTTSEYDSPMLYPWTPPTESGLMIDDKFFALDSLATPFGDSPMEALDSTMNQLLKDNDLATLEKRHLVVAVGANASIAAMSRKLSGGFGARCIPILPFVKTTIRNLAVGHAGYATMRGYIPATPYHSEGAETVLWGSYLDDDQMEQLDATEPNYFRVKVSTKAYPMTMDNGEVPEFFWLYDSYRGVISEPSGDVIPLSTQQNLHDALAKVPALAHRFAEEMDKNVSKFRRLGTRESIDTELKKSGLLLDTGIECIEKVDIEGGWMRRSRRPLTTSLPAYSTNSYSQHDRWDEIEPDFHELEDAKLYDPFYDEINPDPFDPAFDAFRDDVALSPTFTRRDYAPMFMEPDLSDYPHGEGPDPVDGADLWFDDADEFDAYGNPRNIISLEVSRVESVEEETEGPDEDGRWWMENITPSKDDRWQEERESRYFYTSRVG